MALPIRIIKIDPNKRLIVQMPMVPSIKGVRALIGVSKVSWRKLLDDVDGEMLLVAAKRDRDRGKQDMEWRFRGLDNTAGISFLFGTLNRGLEGMWHCPVDVAWVEKNIIWCKPGEDAPAAEVAERLGVPVCEGSPGVEEAKDALLEEEAPSAGAADDSEGGASPLASEEG